MAVPHMIRLLAGIALVGGCDSGPITPTPPPVSPPSPSSLSVSGRVEALPDGRPVGGTGLNARLHGPWGWRALRQVTADADGRFAIHDFGNPGIQDPPPVAGSTLVLTRSIGSSGIPDDGLTQACAAAVRIDGDMELNVELVPWRSRELTRGSSSPSLSGMVYEVTPDGRRPVADAWIAYDVLCMLLDPDNGGNLLEISEAAQRTDADGRYELCRLPVGGPSWIQNACVHVRKDGLHSVQTQRVTLQGSNTVLDIELHRNQH